MKEVDLNPNFKSGKKDISASGWLAWDTEALYLALEVSDDANYFPDDTVIWNFDSLQIGLDGLNDAEGKNGYDRNDYEFEIALMENGNELIYASQYPAGFISDIVEQKCEVKIQTDGSHNKVYYEVRIPGSVLPSIKLKKGRVFGFNFIVNDNDKGGKTDREGWLELTPGIGYGKEPAQFMDVVLWP